MRYLSARQQFVSLLNPFRYLQAATARILIQRDVEFFYQIVAAGLEIKGVVLRIVFRAFGAVISELVYVVKAHHVIMLFKILCFRNAAHLRV